MSDRQAATAARPILTDSLGNLFNTQTPPDPQSILCRASKGGGRSAMQDVVMLLFTVVFFAMAFLYVVACQKLR